MRTLGFCFSILVLGLILATPGLAQDPAATPDPQAILNRADEVSALTEVTAQQNANTIELVRWLVWIVGVLIVIATFALGFLGFSTKRGFQDSMNEYKGQLQQMQTAYQTSLDQYKADQKNVQKLQAEMAKKVQEIEDIRESITDEFTAAKQAVVLLSLGCRLYEERKVDFAIEAFEEARRLVRDDPRIEYHLGRAYSDKEEFENAIKAFRRAIGAKPDYAEAYAGLGLAYRRKGDDLPAEEQAVQWGLAIEAFQRAIELRPRDDRAYSDALSTLGGIYRRQREYKKALHYYQSSLPYDKTTYALNNVASLAWVLEDEDLARASFRRVEEIATEEITAGREPHWRLYDRALARLVLGDSKNALADQQQAIALTTVPSHYKSVLNVLYFLKQAPTAIDGLDQFINLLEQELPND